MTRIIHLRIRQQSIKKIKLITSSLQFPLYHFYQKSSKNFLKKTLIHLAYKRINTLGRFIRGHKDVRPKLFHTNVVYKIDCRDCEASYMGQTGRCLKTRINEHKNHIIWNTTQHSVITEHRISHQHDFYWGNVKILDKEKVLNKRLISEAIYIKHQK